jgi:hypothetical protein
MSDVSAVVLTLGERTTERALASLRRQSAPPAKVVVMTGEVRPFHRALNQAAERVRTPFFIQVDADMILDPYCLEALRAAVREDAGMVIGQLLDPMLGAILGVRLFRRRCVEEAAVPDTIAPATDFELGMQRSGWSLLCALRRDDGRRPVAHLFGEHQPDYTALYVFRKFSLSGARNRYRKTGDRLRAVFQRLHRGRHPGALLARVAAAHAIFRRTWNDRLGHENGSEEFHRVMRFMQSRNVASAAAGSVGDALAGDRRAAFHAAVALGVELYRQGAFPSLAACVEALAAHADERAWVVTVGLCHGLFFDRYDGDRTEADFAWLEPLLAGAHDDHGREAADAQGRHRAAATG